MPETKTQETYITLAQAALYLQTAYITLINWYKWVEHPDFYTPKELKLPEYVLKGRRKDGRNTKLIKLSDLPMFEEFQRLLKTKYYGAMADYNEKYRWGSTKPKPKDLRFRQHKEEE